MAQTFCKRETNYATSCLLLCVQRPFLEGSYSEKQESALRKHAYSNILKIFPPKNENFLIKISDIFYISAQNIDCGDSLVPTIYVFEQKKKNNVYPC